MRRRVIGRFTVGSNGAGVRAGGDVVTVGGIGVREEGMLVNG